MRTRTPAAALVLFVALAWTAPALAEKPTERRLHPGAADASSFLWNDWNRFQENYHPLYVLDDDPKTAWVEGAKNAGEGEWIRLGFTPMEGATQVRLRIRNGYQKSKTLFQANARLKAVTFELHPSGAKQTVTLKDAQGWQEVILKQPAGRAEAVRVTVDSVYPGRKYTDLCLSDVQVFVTATTRENPAFEKSRLERVLAWKRSRVDAAKLFKTQAAKKMPIARGYRVAELDAASPQVEFECTGPTCRLQRMMMATKQAIPAAHAAHLDMALAAAKAGFEGWSPVQVVPQDKRPVPAVDGLHSPELWSAFEGPGMAFDLPSGGKLGMLTADGLGVFDVKDAPSVEMVLSTDVKACQREDRVARFAWATRESRPGAQADELKSRVKALLWVQCGSVDLREGPVPMADAQILVYGPGGRLSMVVSAWAVQTFEWAERGAGDPYISAGHRWQAWGWQQLSLTAFEPVAAR